MTRIPTESAVLAASQPPATCRQCTAWRLTGVGWALHLEVGGEPPPGVTWAVRRRLEELGELLDRVPIDQVSEGDRMYFDTGGCGWHAKLVCQPGLAWEVSHKIRNALNALDGVLSARDARGQSERDGSGCPDSRGASRNRSEA